MEALNEGQDYIPATTSHTVERKLGMFDAQ